MPNNMYPESKEKFITPEYERQSSYKSEEIIFKGGSKMKKELIETILEELNEVTSINWNMKEYYQKSINRALQGYEIIKTTGIDYCQSCGEDFKSKEIVYYAPIDNNIICEKCSQIHEDREPRIVVR